MFHQHFTVPVLSVPGPPVKLQVLGCTISQLKIGWEPPAQCNGIIKGYYVYLGKYEVVFLLSIIDTVH